MEDLEKAIYLKSLIDKKTKNILDKILKKELNMLNLSDTEIDIIENNFNKDEFKEVIKTNYNNGGILITKKANCYMFVNLYIMFNMIIKNSKDEDFEDLAIMYNDNIQYINDTEEDLKIEDDKLNEYLSQFDITK